MGKGQRDPWSRSLGWLIAMVMAPGLVLGAGVWTASHALNIGVGADRPPPCEPVTVQAPLQNTFTINVLNARAEKGAAAAVAKQLPLRDLKTGTVGNDTELRKVAVERDWPIMDFAKPVAMRSRVNTPESRRAAGAATLGAVALGLAWYAARRRR